MSPFALPKIEVASLRGYREDKLALSRFERKWALPCQLGFFMAMGGFVATIFFEKREFWSFGLIGGGLGIGLVALLTMFFSTPVSETGRP